MLCSDCLQNKLLNNRNLRAELLMVLGYILSSNKIEIYPFVSMLESVSDYASGLKLEFKSYSPEKFCVKTFIPTTTTVEMSHMILRYFAVCETYPALVVTNLYQQKLIRTIHRPTYISSKN